MWKKLRTVGLENDATITSCTEPGRLPVVHHRHSTSAPTRFRGDGPGVAQDIQKDPVLPVLAQAHPFLREEGKLTASAAR